MPADPPKFNTNLLDCIIITIGILRVPYRLCSFSTALSLLTLPLLCRWCVEISILCSNNFTWWYLISCLFVQFDIANKLDERMTFTGDRKKASAWRMNLDIRTLAGGRLWKNREPMFLIVYWLHATQPSYLGGSVITGPSFFSSALSRAQKTHLLEYTDELITNRRVIRWANVL